MSEKCTVLYVDDEPINLQLFKLLLGDKYNVITAISGEQGLEMLEKNSQITVVFSDMKMPEMNGLEFITTAKEKYSNLRYYILTGYEITDEITNAIQENIILKYLKKPFNIKEIENAINSL